MPPGASAAPSGLFLLNRRYPGRRCALPWANLFWPRWGKIHGNHFNAADESTTSTLNLRHEFHG